MGSSPDWSGDPSHPRRHPWKGPALLQLQHSREPQGPCLEAWPAQSRLRVWRPLPCTLIHSFSGLCQTPFDTFSQAWIPNSIYSLLGITLGSSVYNCKDHTAWFVLFLRWFVFTTGGSQEGVYPHTFSWYCLLYMLFTGFLVTPFV